MTLPDMKTKYAIISGTLLASFTTSAQDLNKEITIDRDIVPAQRAATRPVVFPSVTPPAISPVTLRMEERATALGITPGIAPYEPARDLGAFPATPWRGYADLGYFPAADFGLSAGYTIIDKAATRLNVWLQADGRSYKNGRSSFLGETVAEDFKWKSLDIAGGLGFSQKFGGHNRLDLSTDVAYSTTSYPELAKDFGNFRWHFDGLFSGRANDRLTYRVGAGVGIFHNRQQELKWDAPEGGDLPMPVNQTSASLEAGLRHQATDNIAIGIDIEGRMLHYSTFLTPGIMAAGIYGNLLPPAGGKTLGQVDFIPAVEYNAGSFYGRAGARLGLSVNSGSSFHVAPDVTLGVNPSSAFGAWLRLGGGVDTNSLESMWQRSRYADPRQAYEFSNVAFTGQLGVRVGPFKGLSLTLTADYAAANDWYMPMVEVAGTSRYNLFAPGRVRAWKLGARVDWSYRDIVTVALSYDYNPGDGADHAWLYWTDRARQVIGASVSVRPLPFLTVMSVSSPLSVDLGVTSRIDRRQWVESATGTDYVNGQDYLLTEGYALSEKLGDLTNLWAGASWRFTPALTVFARFDNILDRRVKMVFGAPTQGFTGLFGLGYKF